MMESDFIDEEQIPLLQREDNYDDVYDDNIANLVLQNTMI